MQIRTKSFQTMHKRQSGVVLVIVVLAVALMATLMALMVEDQHLFVRQVANQRVAEQGVQYANGMNAWAARVLTDDSNPTVDYLGEDWALFGRPEPEEDEDSSFSLGSSNQDEEEDEPIVNFGIDGVTGAIEDLQGRYNLNNLANPDQQFLSSQRRILQNLLGQLEIGESADRNQLVENLIDWVDENDTSRSVGLESGDYQSRDLPYQASDQKLSSLGELRFIDGFTQEVINAIEPHVTVLPVDNARININTTTTQVLASLSNTPVADTGSVDAFLAARIDENFLGFQAAQIRQAEEAIIAVSPVPQQPIQNMMQVTSQFFEIQSRVELGESVYCLQSLILRGGATAVASTLPTPGNAAPVPNIPAPDGGASEERSINEVPAISVLRQEYSNFCEDQSQIPIEESDEDISET